MRSQSILWGGRSFVFLPALVAACSGAGSGDSPVLTGSPLHLEEHLTEARIEAAAPPTDPPTAWTWSFDTPEPGWRTQDRPGSARPPAGLVRSDDGLRVLLVPAGEASRATRRNRYEATIYVDVPEWRREDWAYLTVRARASRAVTDLAVMFNLRDPDSAPGGLDGREPFEVEGAHTSVIGDESVHTYVLRIDWVPEWEGESEDTHVWRQLALRFSGPISGDLPGSAAAGIGESESVWVDVLSVRAVPKGAEYAAASVGTGTEARGTQYRRALWARTPARLSYAVRVPTRGRLDFGTGVLREEPPVVFRVVVEERGRELSLFEGPWQDSRRWEQRSVDLSAFAGRTVTLVLESLSADPDRVEENVAFWTAPTLSGSATSERPNIIFYVIDGAAADQMSVYGYPRRTTPNLEMLAREGVVFEAAYSNSSWSKTSTPSFMTSLHHSVLGGYTSDGDALPDNVVTMAEHLHRGGYQTAVLTTNPYAGLMSSLDRGVDVLRESGVERNVTSSTVLHRDFRQWRASYPGTPFWVHFQTTDVHWPWRPLPPKQGLFTSMERRSWHVEVEEATGTRFGGVDSSLFDSLGIDREAFVETTRDLYDETLVQQDAELGELVAWLKSEGQWENTVLVVTADHGTAQVFDAPRGSGRSIFSHAYRVPLIVVWPSRIEGERRYSHPVSLIDVLPTLLDLAGSPAAEVAQGRSLAPFLLGQEELEPVPAIIDEFYVDGITGELSGDLAMIDGPWLAWLSVYESGAEVDLPDSYELQLYDRSRLPLDGVPVNDEFPDVATEYTRRLREQWQAHRALRDRFTRGTSARLTPEQLRTLRSLGYIR